MVKRVESGLHGPTLLLEDNWEDRAKWDDVEIDCYTDADGQLCVDVYGVAEAVNRG